MGSHTPGPWVRDDRGEFGQAVDGSTSDGGVFAIARINNERNIYRKGHDLWQRGDFAPCSREQLIADATLIAAAPDLLKALRELLPWAKGTHHDACDCVRCVALCAAHEAVAKADGYP